MKKSIIILCVLFSSLRAAESNSYRIAINKTTFCVAKGNMYNRHSDCGVMVVGLNQQSSLSEPEFDDVYKLGDMFVSKEKMVRVIPPGYDSGSSDDVYRSWEGEESKSLYKQAVNYTVSCDLVTVYEPRIGYGRMYKNPKNYEYFTPSNRRRPLLGDVALQAAGVDLYNCYKNLLQGILDSEEIINKKKVVLQQLSIDLGFPRDKAAPIIFKAIIDFISSHPEYDELKLFVTQKSELQNYKRLMLEYIEANQKK